MIKLLKANYRALRTMVSGVEREVLRSYRRSLHSVREQMSDIYLKYSVAGSLTYAEMTKYNRLNLMFDNLAGEIKAMSARNGFKIRRLSGDIYEEAFYRGAFTIEKSAQAKIGFYKLRPEEIRAAVQMPLSGLTLNERLARNRADIIIRVREQVTQGLIQGESYPKMGRRITEVFNKDAEKALRVARTEAHRCQSMGIKKSFDEAEEKGVNLKRTWDAAADDRTREDHLSMDGREPDEDGLYTLPDGSRGEAPGLTGEASQDINCRCREVATIEGFEPEFKRVRGEGVVPYEGFEEWKTNRLIDLSQ